MRRGKRKEDIRRRSHLYNLMATHATRQLKTGRCARGGGGKGKEEGRERRWGGGGAAAARAPHHETRRYDWWEGVQSGRILEQKRLLEKVRSEGHPTVSRA